MDAVSDHQACRAPGGLQYARHRPEETLLYQIIDDNYADCLARFEAEGRSLPRFVRREFEDYLKCGRLEHGFLRVRCSGCHVEKLVAFSCKRRGFCPSCGARRMVESAALLVDEVLPAVPMRQWVLSVPFALRFLFATNPAAIGAALRIVYRTIIGFMVRKAGLTRSEAQCGSVTLIQRFGSARNLNVHFHMLIPDGVYLSETEPPYFRGVSPPTTAELQGLVRRISERIGRHLECKGLLVRQVDSSHLTLEPGDTEDALSDLQGHSVTYRIALGPHKGRKAFMGGRAIVDDRAGPDPLCAEDPMPGRHHARDVRAAGFSRAPGRFGAEPRGESDPLARGVCAQSSVQGADRARQTRPRWRWRRAGRCGAAAGSDELGAAPEAGVRHPD
jgi:ribosomal protein S27E